MSVDFNETADLGPCIHAEVFEMLRAIKFPRFVCGSISTRVYVEGPHVN